MAEAAREDATAMVTAAKVASREKGFVHAHAEVASPERKVAAMICCGFVGESKQHGRNNF